jgi:hypothetical protein
VEVVAADAEAGSGGGGKILRSRKGRAAQDDKMSGERAGQGDNVRELRSDSVPNERFGMTWFDEFAMVADG